jgi:hypothetical protein
MSASWASSRSAHLLTAAALAAGLLLGSASPAMVRAAPRDSIRAVEGVRVTDRGIRIRGGSDAHGDTVPRAGRTKPVDADIMLGDQHIRIRGNVVDATGNGKNVHVVGPIVQVNGENADMVRVFSDAEVAADERVEGDVVAVFGSVRVRGRVSGNAIAVFGSIRLDPGAVVDGDAVAVGGVLDQEPGAVVSGQSVSVEPGIGRLLRPGALVGSGGLMALVALLLLVPMLLGALFLVIAPARMMRVAATAADRPLISLLLGMVSGPLAFILMCVLFITLVGIPLALLTPLFYGVLSHAGFVAATCVIGSRLLRRDLGQGGTMAPYFTGSLFSTALTLLGLAGLFQPGIFRPMGFFLVLLAVLFGAGLSMIGTGAALLTRFGSAPREPVGSASFQGQPAP